MNELDILISCVALMVKEQAANMDNTSDDMIKSTIEVLTDKGSKWYTGRNTVAGKMADYVLELIEYKNDGERLDVSAITRFITLELLAGIPTDEVDGELALNGTIKDTLLPANDYEVLVEDIKRLRRMVFSIYQEYKAKSIIRTANIKISKGKLGSKLTEYLENVQLDIDKINKLNVRADEAIMGELDLDSDDIETAIDDMVNDNLIKTVYKTGWQGVNAMTQGGLRSGESIFVGALSHRYKTGTTLSLFAGVCLANTFTVEDNKKPLAVWISFEDDLANIIEHLYRLIYVSKNDAMPDMSTITLGMMVKYVQVELQSTGINVKIIRVNPTMWSYKDLFNKVEQFRSRGFNVKMVVTDYLDKLPTVGCDRSGPLGADKKDLVRRVRNFMSSRDIVYITPWQLNSAANELLRSGLPDIQFVKEISGKSYYAGNSTLNTDIDLELFVHTAKSGGATYLTVQRGKHRLPTTVSEDKMFLTFKFPPIGPIALDFDKDKPISSKSIDSDGNTGGMFD